ncbi:SOS response UmuD protein [Chromohalobacter marismortui]|uniref:SOS response UmuD protein n=1 Tax=Chromohalobacter marismortui TaxID=42055 RepID=A0A4R7NW04_9GAMM|nr:MULTISPECIES: S24 family peptidase [Chromohalobacter]MCI0510582.1 LexA family transcriptional regulator [Chromohalobacter sp.]MCI0591897.1 LexA family transcriptional regulator [Chromohalobacter sp.]TDU24841.1 SOS response UmuD protein [Chromohalobacter marismortui]
MTMTPIALAAPASAPAPSDALQRGASGFPSPADDYREAPLNLHHHLVRRPASTFFMRLEGDDHRHAGLHHGDLLVIDRAISPRPGHWLVAAIDGELSVLRLERRQSRLYLAPSRHGLATLPFEASDDRLWGVICYAIHALPATDEESAMPPCSR